MQRVNAAICKLARHTRHRRIIAPAHPRIVRIPRIAVVTVAEVRDHKADLADLSGANHGAGLPDHRVGRVAVVHCTDLTAGLGNADNLFALFDVHCHRLFT